MQNELIFLLYFVDSILRANPDQRAI